MITSDLDAVVSKRYHTTDYGDPVDRIARSCPRDPPAPEARGQRHGGHEEEEMILAIRAVGRGEGPRCLRTTSSSATCTSAETSDSRCIVYGALVRSAA